MLLSLPPRVRFRLPVLSGVSEEQTEAERRVRVEAMQHLLDDLGPQAKEISEINAASIRSICASSPHRSATPWNSGSATSTTAPATAHFVSHYGEIRRHSEQASVFDLRLDDRILVQAKE